jgi:hypothetical protein
MSFRRVFVPARPRSAPIVFYLGCNALRTPHPPVQFDGRTRCVGGGL